MVATITVRVELSKEALAALMRPIAGAGGFPALLRSGCYVDTSPPTGSSRGTTGLAANHCPRRELRRHDA